MEEQVQPINHIVGQCQEDVTPLLTHWSYVYLTLTHWYGISSTLSEDRERAFIYCQWAFNEIDIDFRQRRGKPVGLVGWFHAIGGQCIWAIGTMISVDSAITLGLVCVYPTSWWPKFACMIAVVIDEFRSSLMGLYFRRTCLLVISYRYVSDI